MIKVANAPCSWGALEFELEGKALGFKQVLDEMVETGYAGTELGDWGFMPTQPDELKQVLQTKNLELLGAFVPVALSKKENHKEGVNQALKTAELMYNAGYKNAFIILADENGTVEMFSAVGRLVPWNTSITERYTETGFEVNGTATAFSDWTDYKFASPTAFINWLNNQ